MTEFFSEISVGLTALMFTVIFCSLIIPALIEDPDAMGAFAAGFVNPYSSGYSTDVICCAVILTIWIIYESPKVKYGWVCESNTTEGCSN